jgi:NAD(P)-dependent dehydrogenase (short-subunit alcohol dehydrogenase family)
MTNLSGKTALVTGASRGIGRASALALADSGAQVLVHYSSGEKEAAAVVARIRSAGGKAEKISADLRAPEGPHALAERVRAVVGGRLDILVANAGIAKASTIEETTVQDFDALFAVNVRAPILSRAAAVADHGQRQQCRAAVVSRRARLGWRAVRLCSYQGSHRYLGQTFRLRPGRSRHSSQCRRARRGTDRHVKFRQDRIGTRFHAGHPGAQADGCTRRHRRSDYFPRVR